MNDNATGTQVQAEGDTVSEKEPTFEEMFSDIFLGLMNSWDRHGYDVTNIFVTAFDDALARWKRGEKPKKLERAC